MKKIFYHAWPSVIIDFPQRRPQCLWGLGASQTGGVAGGIKNKGNPESWWILVELKRQGLTRAEPRTRRRGLMLPATARARPGSLSRHPGPAKPKQHLWKKRWNSWMLSSQLDSHWRFLLACLFSILLTLHSVIYQFMSLETLSCGSSLCLNLSSFAFEIEFAHCALNQLIIALYELKLRLFNKTAN